MVTEEGEPGVMMAWQAHSDPDKLQPSAVMGGFSITVSKSDAAYVSGHWTVIAEDSEAIIGTLEPASTGNRDVNNDGAVNIVDLQLLVNQVLGLTSGKADINGDGAADVVDIQLLVNAILGVGCGP